MYVSQATVRPFIHICRTLFHPTLIQQATQGSAADGFHYFIPTGFRLGVVERNQDLLASLSIQQRRKITLGRLSVNLLNHHTRFHLCRLPVERTFFHHFIHLHAFARVTPVIQQSQTGGSFLGSRTVTASRVRHVQFTQQFAQHFRIVILVVDMRQETTVISRHGLPVYSVHLHVIKTFLLLTTHVIVHIIPFSSQVHLHIRPIRNRLQLLPAHVHLLHGT